MPQQLPNTHLYFSDSQQGQTHRKENPDVELFIRKNFETHARIGCGLLLRHYYQPLCSHVVRFVHSKAIAEDIVSEIFYQFYSKDGFQITSSYRAYLYKAVRHQAYNYLRREANRSMDLKTIQDFSISAAQQPDSVTQYEELYLGVESAINTLPPQRRKTYLMHRFESKKYEQIACDLHLSVRTVEGQIRKGIFVLRAQLRQKSLLLLSSFLYTLLQ